MRFAPLKGYGPELAPVTRSLRGRDREVWRRRVDIRFRGRKLERGREKAQKEIAAKRYWIKDLSTLEGRGTTAAGGSEGPHGGEVQEAEKLAKRAALFVRHQASLSPAEHGISGSPVVF